MSFVQMHRNIWNLQDCFDHGAVSVSSVESMNFNSCFAVNLGLAGHTDDWDFFLLSCEESWLQNTLLAIDIASWLCAKAFNKESHSKVCDSSALIYWSQWGKY